MLKINQVSIKRSIACVALVALAMSTTSAHATYWNVFNVEGESVITADIVTYATLTDMLGDTNRTGSFSPNPSGFGVNIVGSGSDGTAYWNVFNVEGESVITADIVTYATLTDMLGDTNRTGSFSPNPSGFGVNIVGSGSDGTAYWNVFNVEGESVITADIVTYATLTDMLGDTNRTGSFSPNPSGFGVNIVGSGSDGTAYWNVFNVEGESVITADIVTYATLTDMLGDTNRTGSFSPNPSGFGVNIVGSGASISVPEPATLVLMGLGLAGIGYKRYKAT